MSPQLLLARFKFNVQAGARARFAGFPRLVAVLPENVSTVAAPPLFLCLTPSQLDPFTVTSACHSPESA